MSAEVISDQKPVTSGRLGVPASAGAGEPAERPAFTELSIAQLRLAHRRCTCGAFGAFPAAGRPRIEEIVEFVAESFGVSTADLVSIRRTRGVVLARHVACYVARRTTCLSYGDIAAATGGGDSSTPMYAVAKLEGRMVSDVTLREQVEALIAQISRRGPLVPLEPLGVPPLGGAVGGPAKAGTPNVQESTPRPPPTPLDAAAIVKLPAVEALLAAQEKRERRRAQVIAFPL